MRISFFQISNFALWHDANFPSRGNTASHFPWATPRDQRRTQRKKRIAPLGKKRSICKYTSFVIILYGSRTNIVSDEDDRSLLLVTVYRKHHIGKDQLVGTINDTIGGTLGKLKDGGTMPFCTSCSTDASSTIKVLEDTLHNDASDQSDLSGITIKFALSAERHGSADADERQATYAIAAATDAITSTPAVVGLLDSAVNAGTNIATELQALETTRVWAVLMERIELLNKIVTGIAEVFGARPLGVLTV